MPGAKRNPPYGKCSAERFPVGRPCPIEDMWQKKESANLSKRQPMKSNDLLDFRKQDAFKHDLTAYVLNIWGKMLVMERAGNRILYNLRYKINYSFIRRYCLKMGIPEDAPNLLINWGEARDTEWNGVITCGTIRI
jgi:hypothetical protein